jgi:hypothetical protein
MITSSLFSESCGEALEHLTSIPSPLPCLHRQQSFLYPLMSNLQPPPPTSSRPTSTTPLLSSSSKSQERASPATKMFLPLTDPRTRDYIIGIILLLGVVLMYVSFLLRKSYRLCPFARSKV